MSDSDEMIHSDYLPVLRPRLLTARRGAAGQHAGREWTGCRSTATRPSSCAPRSWARPTGSSRCSPAGTAGSGRSPRASGARLAVRRAGRAVQARRPAAATRAARSTSSPRPRRSTPFGERHRRRLRALHRGHGGARDRRAAHRRGARAGAAALPARRRRAARARRGGAHAGAGARRVPAAGDGGRRLRAGARRLRPVRRSPARTGSSPSRPAASCAPSTARPARRTVVRSPRSSCSHALLEGDWAVADASEPRHPREGSGLVAAYLQWHLERGLRSLRLVER